jgi:hypothetical protein
MSRKANQQKTPPGDLVYLSGRKLLNLAVQLGVKTSSLKVDHLEGSTGISVGVPSVAQGSAKASVHAKRSDPGEQERATARLLENVIKRLGRDGLPNLESAEDIYEAGWFRFHRRLRFGMGSADSDQSVRALVVVDEDHVPEASSLPALLMTGSTVHVRPPYTNDEMDDAPGSRSGSGSGRLFQWLDATRRALETDPNADLNAIETPISIADHPLRETETALEMYRVFSEDRHLKQPQFPQLLHGAPCEGVAQASFIAASEHLTLVMGSPLFLRVRALPQNHANAETQ